jgi:hypothetical protein
MDFLNELYYNISIAHTSIGQSNVLLKTLKKMCVHDAYWFFTCYYYIMTTSTVAHFFMLSLNGSSYRYSCTQRVKRALVQPVQAHLKGTCLFIGFLMGLWMCLSIELLKENVIELISSIILI